MMKVGFSRNRFAISALLALAVARTALGKDELPEGFKVEVVFKPEEGCERLVKNGDVVEVHYTGHLSEELGGTKFDSSHDRGQPIKYQTGAHQVIRGWDLGIEGMCMGEKRKLTVPPELGYGDQGAGEAVPPGATLVFDVELVSVEDGGPVENVFKAMDADGDNVLTREELNNYIDNEMTKMKGQVTEQDMQHLEENKNSIIEEIFKHDDANRDGVISHEEFSGPKHDEL